MGDSIQLTVHYSDTGEISGVTVDDAPERVRVNWVLLGSIDPRIVTVSGMHIAIAARNGTFVYRLVSMEQNWGVFSLERRSVPLEYN